MDAVYWSPGGVCDVCGCLFMCAATFCCLTCNVKFFDSVRDFLAAEAAAEVEAEVDALDKFVVKDDDLRFRRLRFLETSSESSSCAEEKCLCCDAARYLEGVCNRRCVFEGDCTTCPKCVSVLERRAEFGKNDGVHVAMACLECQYVRTRVHAFDEKRMCSICCAMYL